MVQFNSMNYGRLAVKKGVVKMKKSTAVISLLFLASMFCSAAFAEDITLTTYYPAPFGVYRSLQVLDNNEQITIGGWSAVAGGAATSPAIELRDLDTGVTAAPFITFANDAVQHDMWIALAGDDDLNVAGGRTTFMNADGTPAVVRVSEVWFCPSY